MTWHSRVSVGSCKSACFGNKYYLCFVSSNLVPQTLFTITCIKYNVFGWYCTVKRSNLTDTSFLVHVVPYVMILSLHIYFFFTREGERESTTLAPMDSILWWYNTTLRDKYWVAYGRGFFARHLSNRLGSIWE